MAIHRESRVLTGTLFELFDQKEKSFLLKLSLEGKAVTGPPRRLKYQAASTLGYAQRYCTGENDCPDGAFPLDCTHFAGHALDTNSVRVSGMDAFCSKQLCIRVVQLAAAFDNVVTTGKWGNVSRIGRHDATRKGDFCFIPTWFGLSKEHVMILAETATPTGAKVFAHTNNRCGDFVPFEGADCAYYRIADAS